MPATPEVQPREVSAAPLAAPAWGLQHYAALAFFVEALVAERLYQEGVVDVP